MRQNLRMLFLLMFSAHTVMAQTWNKNLDAALRQAGAERKQVFLLFSVPGNCALCEDLEKNVLGTKEFLDFAGPRYVLARPDFSGNAPYESKADNLLIVEEYDKDGFFPWVVILDPGGKIAGRPGQYDGQQPEAYIALLNKIPKNQ